MCGIFAVYGNPKSKSFENQRDRFLNCSSQLRHRGPDSNGIYINETTKCVICHERLAIVDVTKGRQPIHGNIVDNHSSVADLVVSVNGEIYNHADIKRCIIKGKYNFGTESDSEVLIPLYREFGDFFLNMLDGVFAFFLYDASSHNFLVARDPLGVNPLYYAINHLGEYCFASELKAIRVWDSRCEIKVFPPGHYMNMNLELIRYYNPTWSVSKLKLQDELNEAELLLQIRTCLSESVRKRMMCDVPFGTLLSGGLDSSLITSIAQRMSQHPIHTFSIGLEGSPDLEYARSVSEFLNTNHSEFHFTVQEGLDVVREVVFHLESYDVTTIRASVPMYLLAQKIKATTDVKMILSGEGADEILGGYLYFHQAPSDRDFQLECIERVKNLHKFDCLRANKSTMSAGLEVRVPFLDTEFLELAVPIPKGFKLRKIEKYCLRKAFDREDAPYLPSSVLWRQKEQFSDGVGYSWIDELHANTDTMYSDCVFKEKSSKYMVNPPETKEALYFREIFEDLFPRCSKTVSYWHPNTEWDGVKSDPSGRVQQIHSDCKI